MRLSSGLLAMYNSNLRVYMRRKGDWRSVANETFLTLREPLSAVVVKESYHHLAAQKRVKLANMATDVAREVCHECYR
jgi:hypothetical protein